MRGGARSRLCTNVWLACLLFLCFVGPVAGRSGNHAYNINLYSGLPSNYVYMVLKDQYGYLWIATNKGVMRFNGYEMKNYSVSNGISANDIWGLKQDRKGRIWLYNFSSRLGYIYKNRYRNAYFDDEGQTLYPTYITQYGNGIIFKLHPRRIGYEQNDTIKVMEAPGCEFHINNKGQLLGFEDDRVILFRLTNGRYEIEKVFVTGELRRAARYYAIAFNQYLVYRVIGHANYITYANLHTGKDTTLHFYTPDGKPDKIIFNTYDNSYTRMSVIGEHNLYEVDSNLNVSVFPIQELVADTAINGAKVSSFYHDSFWNDCVSTNSDGLYINYNEPVHFFPVALAGNRHFKLVGYRDGAGYWWNNSDHKLLSLDSGGHTQLTDLDDVMYVRKLSPVDSMHSMMHASNGLVIFDHNTKKLRRYTENYNYLAANGEYYRGVFSYLSTTLTSYVKSPDSIYVCFTDGVLARLIRSNDTIRETVISRDRYPNLFYDSLTQSLVAYNGEKITIIHNDKVLLCAGNYLLNLLGIGRVEQVTIDKYSGNIFIKDYNKIVIINPTRFTCREMPGNYNLTDARMLVAGDKLIVAGRFGVVFYKFDADRQYAGPVYYPNIKDRFYVACSDCQVSGGTLFLNTDKALYRITIPANDAFRLRSRAANTFPYNFILYYRDDQKVVRSGDTVHIDQLDYKMQFDLVRPTGNGTVKYYYSLGSKDSAWHELNANEWNAAHLEPGVFHDLSVKASDNVWVSDPVLLHVLVQPYWWQTPTGRRGIIAGSILLIAALTLSTIFITRRILIKRNKKRTELLELEVKSIHAQINPHFIFNTLNSALHFIKMNKADAAYKHITKFSRLLRSYLRSSRYRYISLAEEMENLKNYIELQQTRFSFAFTYSLDLVNIADPRSVQIPSLLLQPIVENAINHGLLPLENREGRLYIRLSRDERDATLHCRIEDNGIGRKQAKMAKKDDLLKDESYGDQLLKDLMDIFNKYEKMGIEMNYIDKDAPETGTIVNIIIKNPHYD